MEIRKEMSEQSETLSKCTSLEIAIDTEVVMGFWFSIGVILASKVVESLVHCAEMLWLTHQM